jgi:sugar phosphate isomerase/epimerase
MTNWGGAIVAILAVMVNGRVKGVRVEQRRPVLVSVMQYEDELQAGSLATRDVIAAAARLGADGIEIRPEFWRDKARELPEARELIAGHGLLVTNATRNTLFSDEPDGAARLREDIDDTAALGAGQLRVFSGPIPADDDEAGWAAGRAIVDYAASRGIVLALENYAWTPGGRLAEIARIVGQIASPALGVNIDIGNYVRHGDDVPTAIRALGGRAVSAHLKDQGGAPDFASHPLGGGTLPLGAIMAELERLPQRVIYCFEFRGGGDPDGRIASSLAYLRERRWAG